MADGRRTLDSDVKQPQPWQVDATQNHGGAIGFLLVVVHVFKFQLDKSLTDITVRISPAAIN